MGYLPPFEVLKKNLKLSSIKGKLYVNLEYEEFLKLLKLLLRAVEVDDAWYMDVYPDVAQAVRSGQFRSAKHHFLEVGYFEGRRPKELEVDEAWYLKTNEDVSEGIRQGIFPSAAAHFIAHGYDEGRLPSEF